MKHPTNRTIDHRGTRHDRRQQTMSPALSRRSLKVQPDHYSARMHSPMKTHSREASKHEAIPLSMPYDHVDSNRITGRDLRTITRDIDEPRKGDMNQGVLYTCSHTQRGAVHGDLHGWVGCSLSAREFREECVRPLYGRLSGRDVPPMAPRWVGTCYEGGSERVDEVRAGVRSPGSSGRGTETRDLECVRTRIPPRSPPDHYTNFPGVDGVSLRSDTDSRISRSPDGVGSRADTFGGQRGPHISFVTRPLAEGTARCAR